jgi:hypothetical protein
MKPVKTKPAFEIVDRDSTEPPALALVRPPRFKAMSFTTLRKVRIELSEIYSLAKKGLMPTAEASRLTFILGAIGKLVSEETIEQRLEALEARSDK